ncbi:MAG: amidohydrolase family protein [Psychroflexus halocasei]
MKQYIFMFCVLFGITSFAQDYFPDSKAVKSETSNYVAITSVVIHVNAQKTIKNATLLIKNGKIVEVGRSVKLPENTIVVDAPGKHIYPSFVETYSDFGIKKIQSVKRKSQPQYDANRSGYYWNDHVRPDQEAKSHFEYDQKKAGKLRKAGFGVVNTHIADGFLRGTSALVTLNDETSHSRLLNEKSAQYFAFDRSQQTQQAYPSSTMGFTALLRQFYHDTEAYKNGLIEDKDLAIEAFVSQENLPQVFSVENYLNALRADKIGDQFGVQYAIIGGGDEYKRIDEIAATQAAFILPVNYPKAYDVEDPYLRDYLSLSDMKDWQLAPANAQMLSEKGVDIAFTTRDLKSPAMLLKNLRKSVDLGLDKSVALAALTSVPAKLINADQHVGTLEKGKSANFIISDNELFTDNFEIAENWVQGERHRYKDIHKIDIAGQYKLTINNEAFDLKIKEKSGKYSAEVKQKDFKYAAKLSFENQWLRLILSSKEDKNYKVLSAKIDEVPSLIKGKVTLENGNTTTFTAQRLRNVQEEKSDKKDKKEKEQLKFEDLLTVNYPNTAYGFKEPKQEAKKILFQNATVITGSENGTLENTDVLIKDGKISKIGQNLRSGNAKVIDATGKFLTAGIIDEHSHIALSSVNEGGHNSSAEVKMEDVVNPDDISIYRSLAGGVTTAQLLHGSANPIGGRSAIIKLKWGESADELIYDNSPKFIKFALGENVKQSNWGGRSRFPQSRMGVEQVFRDYFTRAQAYGERKASGEAYRKDEEMETLLEILNKERFISCHSYVQSEINMLMKVAEDFDFEVNTFTHILEGYKVADKMKEHGAGGSTFADWWAYKYEVNDAIPHNAAIMHNQGVTVAINSDDGEMIRRLNQEAAKTMKYGGVSEEEAWKFVTANPAKLLHLNDRVGTIEEGKDADVVLWNAHPLSVYAKPLKTLIEGVVYFDLEKDKKMRQEIKKERQILINQMMAAKNKGMKTQPIKKEEKEFLHCDSLDHINHKHN